MGRRGEPEAGKDILRLCGKCFKSESAKNARGMVMMLNFYFWMYIPCPLLLGLMWNS